MKRDKISVDLLGEGYTLTGDSGLIRRALDLFRGTLEQIKKETQGKELSTHRLGVMVAMLLAMGLVRFQERQRKRGDLVNAAQRRVKDLVRLFDERSKTGQRLTGNEE